MQTDQPQSHRLGNHHVNGRTHQVQLKQLRGFRRRCVTHLFFMSATMLDVIVEATCKVSARLLRCCSVTRRARRLALSAIDRSVLRLWRSPTSSTLRVAVSATAAASRALSSKYLCPSLIRSRTCDLSASNRASTLGREVKRRPRASLSVSL